MTEARLKELEELCEKTPKGPWFAKQAYTEGPYDVFCEKYELAERLNKEEAELIAASRTVIPELIQEIRRLRDE